MSTAEAAYPSPPRPSAGWSDRRFFVTTALLLLALVAWGFAPSVYFAFVPSSHHSMLIDRGVAVRVLFSVHGLIYLSWMLLYCAQVVLVAARDTRRHRQLGRSAAVLIPLVVVLGLATAIVGLKVGFHIPGPPEAFFAVPFLTALGFGAFAWLGYLTRRKPADHKRWMLLATLLIAGAGTARIGAINQHVPDWMDATSFVMPALLLWDVCTLKRVNSVSLWGGLAYLAIANGAGLVGAAGWWMAAVRSVPGLLP